MLISTEKKFIFVHVYKTGGTTLRAIFDKYSYNPSKNSIVAINFINKILGRLRSEKQIYVCTRLDLGILSCHKHATALHIRSCLPDNIFFNFFKFGFVRNPWAWQVSIYNHMKQVKSHYHHDLVNTFTGFDEYLEWRIKEDLHLQSEYLQDTNGDYLVDYVGRLENLQEDIQFIGKRLGMADFEIPHLNKRLKNGDYKNYYTAKTKRLVAEAFVEDIERFGYSFDRHSSDPIITH